MLLFADYETYWDGDYTLRKMTPAEYILDRRFQTHGMAIQVGENGTPTWVHSANLNPFFNTLRMPNYKPVIMVTFNALFDMCITAWRYNYVPDMMIDVLGMVRATYSMEMPRMSLAHVAEHLKLPTMKGDAVHKTLGMRTAELIASGVMDELIPYAKNDVALMVGAYKHMMPSFPLRELKVMDLVLRCAVQPQFVYDKPLLVKHLENTKARKAELIAACGLEYDEHGKCPDLMSASKFKELLEAQGVVVEDKVSPTGRMIPALAKTDTFMQNLLEDDNETVAALAAARLGHKSTLEETRTQRFINIASLASAPGFKSGSAPIPLRYGAAHTHRLGGEWQLNKQNMPRKSPLRKSLTCLEDEEVITADEAQIEARLSAWIAKEDTLLTEFAQNLDPYGQLGAAIFGLPKPVSKKQFNTEHPVERFIGKTGILGLGYGAGAPKFHTMVNTMARVSIPADKLTTFSFDEQMALKAVNMYRARYHRMPKVWRVLNYEGMNALTGNSVPFVLPPVIIKAGAIWGPNGQRMMYPDLKFDIPTSEWTYKSGASRARIYGAKLLENITQWLARVIVMEAALRLDRYHGLRFALQAHDELVFVVKRVDAEHAAKAIKTEMERRPTWAPDLPLEAEVNRGRNYGEAK